MLSARTCGMTCPVAAESLSADPEVRAIVVAGRGPAFSVGIDLADAGLARPRRRVRGRPADGSCTSGSRSCRRPSTPWPIRPNRSSPPFTAIASEPGIDLITACDIRLASSDAIFGVRETPMGLVADVGTLQRLPAIIGPGHLAEMVYTGRDIDAARALRIGLVNDVYEDPRDHLEGGSWTWHRSLRPTPLWWCRAPRRC